MISLSGLVLDGDPQVLKILQNHMLHHLQNVCICTVEVMAIDSSTVSDQHTHLLNVAES